MNADSVETARIGVGLGSSATSPPSPSVVGQTRMPPLAIVANAAVISSSVTSEVPSESDGTAASWLSMPTLCATRATWDTPTPCATSAAGMFNEVSSARRTVTGPWKSPSMLCGVQGPPTVRITMGSSGTIVEGVISRARSSKAARYTSGLKSEPGCRRAFVARLNSLSS